MFHNIRLQAWHGIVMINQIVLFYFRFSPLALSDTQYLLVHHVFDTHYCVKELKLIHIAHSAIINAIPRHTALDPFVNLIPHIVGYELGLISS